MQSHWKKAFAVITFLLIAPSIGEARARQSIQTELEEAKRLQQRVGELFEESKYDEALELAKRALAIRERLLPSDDLDVAETLNDIGVLYQQKGELQLAEPLLLRALAIREKASRPDSSLIIESLVNLSAVYRSKSDYRNAEPLLQRVLSLQEQRLGPEHRDVVTSVNSLALLYMDSGDYSRAGPLFERALAIRERIFGPEHSLYAQSLNNLAALRRDEGEYALAERLFERAVAIREKAPGPDQRDLASSLNNLAGLYQLKGDYDRAEPLFRRALAIRERAQPEGLATAESLNSLALLYKQKKDYEQAEPLYQRSLEIREKRLRADHPDVATTLSNLALLHLEKNDSARAEQLFQRALSIREKTLGSNHYLYAQSISNLASLWFLKGDYDQSELLHRRALQIFEQTLGPQHPLTCLSRNNLAQILSIKGNLSQAAMLLAVNNEAREKNLASVLTVGSEREKLAYMATLSEETDFTISFQAQSGPKDIQAIRLALTTVLRRKGRVVDVMADSINALRRRANPEDRKLLEQLSATRAQLASLLLKGPEKSSPQDHRASIARLEAEVQRLESEVSAKSAQFRALSQPVTLQNVRNAIPRGAVLVEFALYRPFNSRAKTTSDVFGPPRYVAYVLRKSARPVCVELGEAKQIDSRIDSLRTALRDPKRGSLKQLARAVDERVMQPIRPLLGKTVRVLLSPDGALNLIPFAALVDKRGQYLVKQYSFTYLTTGRDLLRMRVRTSSSRAPVVMADPDFGEQTSTESERKLAISSAKSNAVYIVDFSQVYFGPLPGTAEEAVALQQILPGAVALTKGQATEVAIKKTAAPEILHVATHGFFLEAVLSPSPTSDRGLIIKRSESQDSPTPVMRIDNPLLRSGLAFAGANLRQSGDGEDGILTALEAAGLDLWGTRLVVLSACDTAVGEVKTGDGVYGLRRALVIAGAESQVMSLWPVNDAATRDLMIAYYKALKTGQDQAGALRKVQLKMITRKGHQHPHYWASFIHSGQWERITEKGSIAK